MRASLLAALGVVTPSVSPSVSPVFLKQETNRNFVSFSVNSAGQEQLGEQIWDLKVKGQGHWERKHENLFLLTSS